MKAVLKARSRVARHLAWGVLVTLPLAATANQASGNFQVTVEPAPPSHSGICTSEALSNQTQAVFLVTCASGHFVSISPQPGRSFVGTHGGAFRFRAVASSRGALPWPSAAPNAVPAVLPEVATMRVSSGPSTFDKQVEILVSF